MELIAVVLFVVAAIAGVVMAVQRLQGRPRPPLGLALAHGAVAAIALVVYIIVAAGADQAPALAWWAIGIFVVAALGGAVLFLGFHLRNQALPVALVFVHGGVAVVAFLLLLIAVFTGTQTGG